MNLYKRSYSQFQQYSVASTTTTTTMTENNHVISRVFSNKVILNHIFLMMGGGNLKPIPHAPIFYSINNVNGEDQYSLVDVLDIEINPIPNAMKQMGKPKRFPMNSYPSYKYKEIAHLNWILDNKYFSLLREKLKNNEYLIVNPSSPFKLFTKFNIDDDQLFIDTLSYINSVEFPLDQDTSTAITIREPIVENTRSYLKMTPRILEFLLSDGGYSIHHRDFMYAICDKREDLMEVLIRLAHSLTPSEEGLLLNYLQSEKHFDVLERLSSHLKGLSRPPPKANNNDLVVHCQRLSALFNLNNIQLLQKLHKDHGLFMMLEPIQYLIANKYQESKEIIAFALNIYRQQIVDAKIGSTDDGLLESVIQFGFRLKPGQTPSSASTTATFSSSSSSNYSHVQPLSTTSTISHPPTTTPHYSTGMTLGSTAPYASGLYQQPTLPTQLTTATTTATNTNSSTTTPHLSTGMSLGSPLLSSSVSAPINRRGLYQQPPLPTPLTTTSSSVSNTSNVHYQPLSTTSTISHLSTTTPHYSTGMTLGSTAPYETSGLYQLPSLPTPLTTTFATQHNPAGMMLSSAPYETPMSYHLPPFTTPSVPNESAAQYQSTNILSYAPSTTSTVYNSNTPQYIERYNQRDHSLARPLGTTMTTGGYQLSSAIIGLTNQVSYNSRLKTDSATEDKFYGPANLQLKSDLNGSEVANLLSVHFPLVASAMIPFLPRTDNHLCFVKYLLDNTPCESIYVTQLVAAANGCFDIFKLIDQHPRYLQSLEASKVEFAKNNRGNGIESFTNELLLRISLLYYRYDIAEYLVSRYPKLSLGISNFELFRSIGFTGDIRAFSIIMNNVNQELELMKTMFRFACEANQIGFIEFFMARQSVRWIFPMTPDWPVIKTILDYRETQKSYDFKYTTDSIFSQIIKYGNTHIISKLMENQKHMEIFKQYQLLPSDIKAMEKSQLFDFMIDLIQIYPNDKINLENAVKRSKKYFTNTSSSNNDILPTKKPSKASKRKIRFSRSIDD
ncbi:hypothetical protein PPL_06601 [Heterostelium album PN500]|uniref:Uncharacterized protein n=1 Tax=Heterostelium pallidum (strain ATCC 26659 / Pp 5 / PN500) TaxID=670386 RepID=D3BF68_HETP5|nr:hypothetical protein PPL_06601 [Heterostelium album PN500]EFA79782.1 hypothetical protein PPL_06601 [Heterostelium album PN500]|eukprot:XP_020431903.1 hypothetical protein PPL_06601 [Heterostelium album PN500]